MSKTFTFLVFFFSVFLSQAEMTAAATVATTTTAATPSTVVSTSTSTATKIHDAVAVEKKVREYFVDIPVMIEIAKCESKFRQFTDSGSVLRGGGGNGMVGIFQFYEAIHKKGALALGFDINTIEGNLGYARHLFTQSGSTPWASCVPNSMPVKVTLSQAHKELQIKLLTQVLALLQELLKMELAKVR